LRRKHEKTHLVAFALEPHRLRTRGDHNADRCPKPLIHARADGNQHANSDRKQPEGIIMKKWGAILVLTPVLIAIFLGGLFGVNSLRVNKVSEREQWRTAEYTVSDLLVVNDMLILHDSRPDSPDECDCLYALNKLTGEILWSNHELAIPYIKEAKRLGIDPMVNVYIVSHIGDILYANLSYFDKEDNLKYVLFAMRSNDGTVLWQADGVIDYDSFSKSAIETNQIFMGDNEGNLLALDSETGKELWRQKVYDGYYWEEGLGLFAYRNNAILVIDSSSHMRAFSAERGDVIWESESLCKRDLDRNYIFNATLFCTISSPNYQLRITAIDLETGKQRWSLSLPYSDVHEYGLSFSSRNQLFLSIKTYEGGMNDFHTLAKLIVIDEFTGDIEWQFNEDVAHGDLYYLINDDTVFVGTEDGFLYNLDCSNGKIIWQAETEYFPVFFAVQDNSLITFFSERFVAAYDPLSGNRKWILDLGMDHWYIMSRYVYSQDSLAIHDNLLLIVGNHEKTIYAVDLESGEILWSWEHFWPAPARLEISLVDDTYLYVEQYDLWSYWRKLFGNHWFFALKINP
jgi:outer membrane protein assembly factor BamB